MKLNQALAIRKGVTSDKNDAVKKIHQLLQRNDILKGLTKTYSPLEEEGEQLPSETKKVQVRVKEILQAVKESYIPLFDAVATVEYGNHQADAVADVEIEGTVLLEKVPIPYLLFLEKTLIDLRTILNTIPTLDPSESWHYDPNTALYATETKRTSRTKKVNIAITLAGATERHPAQVQMGTEDKLAGYWNLTEYSGAVPMDDKVALLSRVEKILTAIRVAREGANTIPVQKKEIGETVLNFLLGG